MINLLPPPVKEQVHYAKLNAKIVRYAWLMFVTALVIAISFVGSHWYISQRIAKSNAEMERKKADIAKFKPFEEKVQAVNSRLTAIKAIQSSQPKFSTLFNDLAAVTPKGVTIVSLSLTGDEKQPVRIVARANSMNAATAFRENLINSPRIAAADIETVNREPGGVRVNIVVAFKPGQAR